MMKKINLSFCPERTVEGKAFEELSNLPQIISGTTDEAIKEAKKLFSIFCNKILVATSTRIAELAKLSSNIERDVYFSFANELGLISRELKLPTFDYQSKDSLWELYQYTTFAMKEEHPRLWIDNHIAAHDFFVNEAGVLISASESSKGFLTDVSFYKEQLQLF
jgi:hypothetical protein